MSQNNILQRVGERRHTEIEWKNLQKKIERVFVASYFRILIANGIKAKILLLSRSFSSLLAQNFQLSFCNFISYMILYLFVEF